MCSKVPNVAPSNTLRLFYAKCFIIFVPCSWILFSYLLIHWKKMPMLSNKVILNCKAFLYYIDKKHSSHCYSKKTGLWGKIWYKNQSEIQNFINKIPHCFFFFYIKLLYTHFQKVVVRYQWKLMSPIFSHSKLLVSHELKTCYKHLACIIGTPPTLVTAFNMLIM